MGEISILAVMDQMDEIAPRWVYAWADQVDLRELAEGLLTYEMVRNRVSWKVHTALQAAYIVQCRMNGEVG